MDCWNFTKRKYTWFKRPLDENLVNNVLWMFWMSTLSIEFSRNFININCCWFLWNFSLWNIFIFYSSIGFYILNRYIISWLIFNHNCCIFLWPVDRRSIRSHQWSRDFDSQYNRPMGGLAYSWEDWRKYRFCLFYGKLLDLHTYLF